MSRILVLSPIPPPPDGIGSHSERLAEAWHAMGHTVLAFAPGAEPTIEQRDGYQLRRLLGPRHRKEALAAAAAFSPDLVFCQFAVSALTIGAEVATAVCRAAKAAGTPVLMAFHEPLREVSMLGPFGRPAYRFAARTCTMAVTFSTDAAAALEHAQSSLPVVHLPLGVPSIQPPSNDERERVRHAYDLTGPFVLNVGFTHPDKGTDTLVRAGAEIGRLHGGPLDIVIAGRPRRRSLPFKLFGLIDSRYFNSTLRLADDAGGQVRFSFPDYLPDADLWPLLAEASAVVLPYRRTTQSGVAAFVLAAGAAAVATRLSGLEGAFGDAAVYAAPDDPHDLARAVHSVLDDSSAQEALRANARRRAAAESYPLIAERILAYASSGG
jgi:glycosyltransferase involved in cell wall biosynthesis